MKPDELRDDVPHARLALDDADERQRARGHDHADEREALRHLVGDELRRRAHRAEERVLRAARPAAEHEAVERDRAQREDPQRSDRHVHAVQAGLGAEDVRRGAERDDGDDAGGRDDREDRRDAVQERHRVPGPEVLLAEELQDVGDRLQRAERADAVRAVALLEAAEHLAVGHEHDRHEVEDDQEDHQRLQDLHPPRLDVVDVGQDGHARVISTSPPAGRARLPSPRGCRSAGRPCPRARRSADGPCR